MKLRSRLSVFSVAALAVCGNAVGQNDFNNLGNINAANSVDNSKKSSGNSSGNVLDSEELNSAAGDSGQKNSGDDLDNDLNSNAAGGGGDNGFNNAGGGGDNLNNAGGGGNNLNNAGGNGLGGGNGAVGKNAGNSGATNFGLNNGNGSLGDDLSVKNNDKKNKASGENAAGAETGFDLNGGNTAATPPNAAATPPPNAATTPPVNAAAGPDNGSIPPPPEQPPVDPNAVQGSAAPPPDGSAVPPPVANAPATDPKKLSKEEKRLARLELIKKMAEGIPALREGEAPLEYTVQPGDTLWDISDQLLDDASWWPKLWVLNPEVTDPDKIEPGTRLLFYPSTKDKAPELAAGSTQDPFAPPKVDLATLQTFNMEVQRFSGPSGEFIDPARLEADQHLLTVGEPSLNASYMFRIPGFYASDVNAVGEIVSDPNSPMIAGQGQNLIARFDGQTPRPGERFLVVREVPVFTNLDPIRPDGNLFTHTGAVGVVRASSSGYATLVAEDSSSHIGPSDLLIPFNKNLYVPIDPAAPGRPNQAPGFVVATEGGSYQSAGPGIAVYLQGTDGRNPYRVGDDVELFMPAGSSHGLNIEELTPRERVAVARIVEAGADSAVGVIINASREVTAGASTVPDIYNMR